jgi:hypothetical protein
VIRLDAPPDRRSPDRMTGRELWLEYARLKTECGLLAAAGDAMREIVDDGCYQGRQWDLVRKGGLR